MRIKVEKQYHQFELNDEIEKKIIFLQKDNGKKIETKRKRIKLENTIFGKLKLNDEIENK
jgi:hypothetical protein